MFTGILAVLIYAAIIGGMMLYAFHLANKGAK